MIKSVFYKRLFTDFSYPKQGCNALGMQEDLFVCGYKMNLVSFIGLSLNVHVCLAKAFSYTILAVGPLAQLGTVGYLTATRLEFEYPSPPGFPLKVRSLTKHAIYFFCCKIYSLVS